MTRAAIRALPAAARIAAYVELLDRAEAAGDAAPPELAQELEAWRRALPAGELDEADLVRFRRYAPDERVARCQALRLRAAGRPGDGIGARRAAAFFATQLTLFARALTPGERREVFGDDDGG